MLHHCSPQEEQEDRQESYQKNQLGQNLRKNQLGLGEDVQEDQLRENLRKNLFGQNLRENQLREAVRKNQLGQNLRDRENQLSQLKEGETIQEREHGDHEGGAAIQVELVLSHPSASPRALAL